MTLDALAAPILHLLARASTEGALALALACLLATLSRSGRIKSWWLRLAPPQTRHRPPRHHPLSPFPFSHDNSQPPIARRLGRRGPLCM